MSDVIGRRVGMQGRLWWLFFVQMTGAVMCIILGIGPVQASLAHSIGVMIVFSFFIEVGKAHQTLTACHIGPVSCYGLDTCTFTTMAARHLLGSLTCV